MAKHVDRPIIFPVSAFQNCSSVVGWSDFSAEQSNASSRSQVSDTISPGAEYRCQAARRPEVDGWQSVDGHWLSIRSGRPSRLVCQVRRGRVQQCEYQYTRRCMLLHLSEGRSYALGTDLPRSWTRNDLGRCVQDDRQDDCCWFKQAFRAVAGARGPEQSITP